MSFNYSLSYQTFDQVIAAAKVDFQGMSMVNQIEPQQLIPVAKRVNYELGLRINQTKETILDVDRFYTKLPDDFYTLNFALICESRTITQSFPQGTHLEMVPAAATYKETPTNTDLCQVPRVNCHKCDPSPCSCTVNPPCQTPVCETPYNPLVPYGDYCVKPRVFMNCKGDCYEIIQIINPGLTYNYSRLIPVKILPNAQSIDCECPNLYSNSERSAWIKDGFLHTNFKNAKLYLNYQGMMEDDQGNLLVPDHDLLNDYYIYAVKSRILENMFMNDSPNTEKKIQLVEARLSKARFQAMSLVNTPNFQELQSVFDLNRKTMYHRFYRMFQSDVW